MSVEWVGYDLKETVNLHLAKNSAAAKIAMSRLVEEVTAEAQALAPVDTGRLRDSIKGRITDDGSVGIVSVGEFYAAFAEFGTRTEPARPFMRPAKEKVVGSNLAAWFAGAMAGIWVNEHRS